MSLAVVGAGFPRTGTSSLHDALVRLLGGRCYPHANTAEDWQRGHEAADEEAAIQ